MISMKYLNEEYCDVFFPGSKFKRFRELRTDSEHAL